MKNALQTTYLGVDLGRLTLERIQGLPRQQLKDFVQLIPKVNEWNAEAKIILS